MEHNLPQNRSQLLRSDSYAAIPGFLSTLRWHPDRTGHVLARKTGDIAIVSVVGRVLEKKLDCGPQGNFFHKGRYGGLEKTTKFRLYLGKPTDTPFAEDFDKTIAGLRKVQDEIAFTQEHPNLIEVDGQETHLRFTRNVFEQRECMLIGMCSYFFRFVTIHSLRTFLDENEIDDETENWPVPSDLRNDLDNIKQCYRAVPLPVLVENRFIEARDVNKVIKNALVEIRFKLNYYHIVPDNRDSFNGTMEQIRVLQPGKARPVNAHKRKNIRDGPIRLIPNTVLEDKAPGDVEKVEGDDCDFAAGYSTFSLGRTFKVEEESP